jgi:hypothetical protein
MPEVPYSKFRLGALSLAQLDALAASAGSRTQAAREAIAHWHAAVAFAGRQNAEELAEGDWVRLGHLNDPTPASWTWDEEDRAGARDWSAWLAVELAGAWEGRAAALPEHRRERSACHALARRIAGWGPARGYALFAALRWFWSRPDAPEGWWRPEVWMAAEGRA